MSDKDSKSRSRGPNFTREEQELLINVMEPYIAIIESKTPDKPKQRDKQRAWAKITDTYNSHTAQCSRTPDNLISLYRNMKNKIKKQVSDAKKLSKNDEKKETSLLAVDDNSRDSKSSAPNEPLEDWQIGFEALKREVKKTEIINRNNTMDVDPPVVDVNTIKMVLKPEIKGYTEYDDDSAATEPYQESIQSNESEDPLSVEYNGISTASQTSPQISVKAAYQENATKFNAKDAFVRLAEEKAYLVKLNQEIATETLKEKKMDVELKCLQLDSMRKEILFKERMRQKELLLMNLKIKKLSE